MKQRQMKIMGPGVLSSYDIWASGFRCEKISFGGWGSLGCCTLSRLARVDIILLMATRNPARKPADSLSHYLQGFIHPRWFSRQISEPPNGSIELGKTLVDHPVWNTNHHKKP